MPPKQTSSIAPQSSTRFIITKLVLENFKSYAGVQEVGPFHKSFTSIVGANGSGKSNVIDALLFVFGKRAKQIRLNKVSELIHNSDSFRNLDYARVSVYFQDIVDKDGDEFEPVEGTAIVVTRIAYRNNTSKYMIDDKSSNFTEVTTLLRKKGIDLDHNRFLILQGEVELISTMKPKAPSPHEDGMLEYLEDIIGTSHYGAPIEELSKQLDSINEVRNEKQNRVKVSEKELEGLEGPKREAEEFIEKSKELDRTKAVLYQLYCREANQNIQKILNHKVELEEKKDYEQKKLADKTAKLAELEKMYSRVTKDSEVIAEAMAKSKADFATFERKDIKLREDIKHATAKEKKLATQLEKERIKIKESSENVRVLEIEIEELEKTRQSLTESLVQAELDLESMLERVRGETGYLHVQLAEAQTALLPLEKKVQEAQTNVDVGQSEHRLLQEKTTLMDRKLQEAKESLSRYEQELIQKNALLEDRKAQKLSAERRKDELQLKLSSLSQREQELAQQARETRTKLEEARVAKREVTNRSGVLQGLLTASQRGVLRGIIGRLGDLGTIDKKYDVAISTACGALDNIVVDTTTSAQQCVNYLKTHNLGRATFIILEKMESSQSGRKIETPENVPRLYDLVRVKDPKYAPAFYYALRDTLVANDLEQATRVAFNYGRHRVVTLAGQLIESSGTMTGGGTRVNKGGMSSSDNSVTEEEFRELEKLANERNASLQQVRNERTAAEGELKSLTATISQSEMELTKTAMAVESLKVQIQDLQKMIPEIQEKYKPDPKDLTRLKALAKELKAYEADLISAKRAAAGAQVAVQEIQDKINNAGGPELQTKKAQVKSMNDELDQAASQVTKNTVQIAGFKKAIEKSNTMIADIEKQSKETKDLAEKLKEDLKSIDKDAAEVTKKYEEAKKLFEARELDVAKCSQEYEECKKSVETIKLVEVDILNQLEEDDRKIKDNQAKHQHWSKKLQDIRKSATRSDSEITPTGLDDLSPEELDKFELEKLQCELAVLEEVLSKMKPNMGAIKEYNKKHEEYLIKCQELEAITEERDACRRNYDTLRKKRLDEFMQGFSFITMKLKEMYQMITMGGDAELELVDSLDPFTEGIVFSVRPPKKSWKNIANLSGGEKTLSSLSLVFALHQFKPTPLYVMDEIDAALDFRNVSIVANYIKERTKDAQFIIISLRNNMFELADRLVGIYKTSNTTKSVTINPACFTLAPSTAT
eukprot:TRINITY_DN5532_c0_g1_i1.p1 TRINITY_DN5532_c0_g1~~TRINITY_DN5532_c0_g1_i1.p1  ORF type:complete len:1225 (+),score=318.81 TRINITY_DN5532_c0_g1_i1:52-3726(+)